MIPAVLAPGWRVGFLGLVGLAAMEAGAMVGAALLLRSLARTGIDGAGSAAAGLAAVGVAAAGLAWARGVAAERFGMAFAARLRRNLATHAVTVAGAGAPRRLGVLTARMGADVNAVRDWVAVGLCDAASGVTFTLGGLAALALIGGRSAFVAGLAVAAAAGLVMAAVAPALHAATDRLRRERGRVAGLAGDIALAAGGLAQSDPKAREAKRLDRRSADLAGAAVRRRGWAGALLLMPTAAAALGFAAAVTLGNASAAGEWTGVVFAFVLLGGGLTALAKGVDAHAAFAAARRRFDRLAQEAARARPAGAADAGWPGVWRTVRLAHAPHLPPAGPGALVRVRAADPARACAVVEAAARADDALWVDDWPVGALRPAARARRVVLCAPSAPLLRARVERNLTLAAPEGAGVDPADALAWCGLDPHAYDLDRRLEPALGDPDAFAQARLRLARAVMGGARVILVAEPALYGLADFAATLARVRDATGATVIAAAPAVPEDPPDVWTLEWDVEGVDADALAALETRPATGGEAFAPADEDA